MRKPLTRRRKRFISPGDGPVLDGRGLHFTQRNGRVNGLRYRQHLFEKCWMQVDACCLGRFRPTAAVASSTAKWTTAVLSLCRTSVTGLSLQFCHSGCGTTAICRKARLRQKRLAGWRSNHAHAGQNEKILGISRDGGPGSSGVDDKPAWSLTTLADAPTLHVARSWPFMTHLAQPMPQARR